MNSEVMKMSNGNKTVAEHALAGTVVPDHAPHNAQSTADNDFEQISALADGELQAQQAGALLARSQRDPDLRAAWHGYQLIGDVLRGQTAGTSSHSVAFLANFHAQIALDDAQMASAQAGNAQTGGGTSQTIMQTTMQTTTHTTLQTIQAIAQPSHALRSAVGVAHSEQLALQADQSSAQPMAQAANDALFRWKLVSGFASMAAVAAIGWGAVSADFLGLGGASQNMAQNTPQSTLGSTSQSAQNSSAVAANSAAQSAAAASGAAGVGAANNALALPAPNAQPVQAAVMLRDPRFDAFLAAHKQFGGASALAQPAGFLRSASFEAGR